MRTRVKLCGVTTNTAANAASAAGADALGFVFYSPSPRAITATKAASITSLMPPFVQRVALFVDERRSVIEETLSQCPLDMIQFHGSESRSFCESLGLPYIKAVGFKTRDELLIFLFLDIPVKESSVETKSMSVYRLSKKSETIKI